MLNTIFSGTSNVAEDEEDSREVGGRIETISSMDFNGGSLMEKFGNEGNDLQDYRVNVEHARAGHQMTGRGGGVSGAQIPTQAQSARYPPGPSLLTLPQLS